MEENEKIYVLRNSSFWYDDDYYSFLISSDAHAGHITQIFDDKEQAIQEWKQLEYEFTHRVGFHNFLGEETFWLLEEIFPDYGHYTDLIKLNLDIDQIFELIHKIDRHAYYLYEYPKQIKLGIVWDNIKNNYRISNTKTEYDFRSNLFIDTTFLKDDPLLNHVYPSVNSFNFTLNGSLPDLSDTPILLTQLIQHNENINYDEDRKFLRIKQLDSSTIKSLNALLKEPIQCLTIEEIYEIEKSLNQTYLKEIEKK